MSHEFVTTVIIMCDHIARQLVLLSCILFSASSLAKAHTYISGPARVTTVELFTSEGCSSCPPAEQWLSDLKAGPDLWKKLVPLAFHVDYWNGPGWVDRFSNARYSARQAAYQRAGHIHTVYTPGFVVNGKEWRKFFNPFTRHASLPAPTTTPGRLTLVRNGNHIKLEFDGDASTPLLANVVFLGMDLKRRISGGENAGRTLTMDFVVLRQAQQKGKGTWQFKNLVPPKEASAIAAWVEQTGDPTPIQAVGGLLATGDHRSDPPASDH